MDDVFDALAHRDRRAILDSLFEHDGQTMGELERQFTVSRFAIMKQLKILERAQLVTSLKVGRVKRHYLNPVPIRVLSSRWISRFAKRASDTLIDLKSRIEGGRMFTPKHVYRVMIRATPQEIWETLTDDRRTPLYQHLSMQSRTEWRTGGRIEFFKGDQSLIVGELLELSPPSRLVMTFSARWSSEVASDAPSRVTWEIAPLNESVSTITLTHDQFGGDTMTSRQVLDGWPETLSRLKTLLETGETLDVTPESPIVAA